MTNMIRNLKYTGVQFSGFILLGFLILMCSTGNLLAQNVVINEVMASNASTIADEDGDYEDWIELYNSGDQPINLAGYGLSDDYDNPFRWLFPDVSIAPGEFLLIWASGKNRNDPTAPLHTNFSISSTGEEVLVTHPDGTLLDDMSPVPIPTDISFGRKPDGSDQWFYFSTPTPGTSNTGEGFLGVSKPPAIVIHQTEEGLYEIELTHENPAAGVFFSTDGSEPNTTTSTLYETPFQLQPHADSLMYIPTSPPEAEPKGFGWFEPQGPFPKGVVVRAVAVETDMIPSVIQTKSHLNISSTIPVISISGDADGFFSDAYGIYVPGDIYHQHGWNHGDWFGRPNANYHQRGDEWERPAHIEIFYPDGPDFSQRVGLRLHGGGSRTMPLKSFRVYARNLYGESAVNFDLFRNGNTGYQRFLLRNSGQDFMATMFRDAAIQEIVKPLRFDTQDYMPAVAFLNGEYWGVHNIRERYDQHYLARVYGVDPDNVDILTGRDEVKEGDNLHYRATIDYIEAHGITEETHYQYILTRIDEQNFMDYQIAQIFSDNTDWPHSNIDFWRLRTDHFKPDSPYGHDGRWRWKLYDVDFGFGFLGTYDYYKHNTLAFATEEDGPERPNPPWATFLLRSFLDNETFRNQFINRFADLLNTAFLPHRTIPLIEEMKQRLEPHMPHHIDRWRHPASMNVWHHKVNAMLIYAEKRPNMQRQHIMEYFDISGMADVRLDLNNPLMGHVRINTIDILPKTAGISDNPYPWRGKYFKGIPIEIKAVAAPGFAFSHWEGTHPGTDDTVIIHLSEDVQLTAHFVNIDEPVLIHYWFFGAGIPNDTPLEELDAFYGIFNGGVITYESAFEGYPYDKHHPLWRKASMERRNRPAAINYRPEGNSGIPYHQSDMRGIQVRQPFRDGDRENTMIWHMPANGFKELVMRFAARDEGAANKILVDYQVEESGDTWKTDGLTNHELPLGQAYQLYQIDFSEIPETHNNPHFRVRFRFDGHDMFADDGNRVTFNNISLDGRSVGAHMIYASAGENGTIQPSGRVPVFDGSQQQFLISPKKNHRIAQFFVDGVDMTHHLQFINDDDATFTIPSVEKDQQVHATFSFHSDILENHDDLVAIYPNPANSEVNIAALEYIEQVRLFRLNGQMVFEIDNIHAPAVHFSTQTLRNGLYIVMIRTESRTVTKKLQIIR